jgi:hypothetical protein
LRALWWYLMPMSYVIGNMSEAFVLVGFISSSKDSLRSR